MDLLELDGQKLYFDEPMPDEVSNLLLRASTTSDKKDGEMLLLKAFALAPENLSVLVALYRTYYYQHNLKDALEVAHQAIEVVGEQVGFPTDWRKLNISFLSDAVFKSMGLVRFYMLALKAEAYIYLRLGEIKNGRDRLLKIAQLDEKDQFGAKAMLEMLANSKTARELEHGC